MVNRADFTHEFRADKSGGSLVALTETEIDNRVAVAEQDEKNAPANAFAWLRGQRDQLLAQSDWMANSDVTMSDAWKTYRQQLRDLPAQYDNTSVLGDITWPTKPS